VRHEDEQDAGEGLTGLTGCPTAGRRPASVPAAPFWIPPSCRSGRSGFWWCGCSRTGRSDPRSGRCWSAAGCASRDPPWRRTFKDRRRGRAGKPRESTAVPVGLAATNEGHVMGPPCAAPGIGAAAPLDQLLTVGGRGVVPTARVRGGAAAGVGPFVRPAAGLRRARWAAPGLHRGPPLPSPAWLDAGCCSPWVRARAASWRGGRGRPAVRAPRSCSGPRPPRPRSRRRTRSFCRVPDTPTAGRAHRRRRRQFPRGGGLRRAGQGHRHPV
jgi:hypothetical protein